jgi:hypothetical protein
MASVFGRRRTAMYSRVRTVTVASTLQFISSPSSHERIAAAARFLATLAAERTALIVGATRAAADELAFTVAQERGGVFGITRASFAELVTKLALPALARESLSPTGGLGAEAIAARAAFEALQAGRLTYFAPVAHLPGFPRRSPLSEVRRGLAPAGRADILQPAANWRSSCSHGG